MNRVVAVGNAPGINAFIDKAVIATLRILRQATVLAACAAEAADPSCMNGIAVVARALHAPVSDGRKATAAYLGSAVR